jgi:hypothetical protein
MLRVVAVLTLVAFAIPIGLAPLAWARSFRWTVDAQPHLALYFGRCVGALALVLSCGAWYAAGHAGLQPFFMMLYIAANVAMVVVHVAGAVQKVQPWTENAEIGFWALSAVAGLLFYPGA